MSGGDRPTSSATHYAAFATIVVVLGMNFLMVRYSNRELAPFWGAGLRFAVASAVLLVWIASRRRELPHGDALPPTLAYGALQFGAAYALLYWALVEVTAGTSGVLFSTIPLLTLVLAVAVGLERLTTRGVVGALLVVAGVAAVFWDQVSAASPWRLAAVLGGALAAAGAGIVAKRGPRMDPLGMNAVGMGVGAVILLVGSVLAGETVALPTRALTWLALAWLVMSSIVGFVLFLWLLQRWSASRTSYAGVLAPVVAVVSGAVFAGERLGWFALAGGAVVLLGVYVGALSGRRPAPAPAHTGALAEPAEHRPPAR